MPCSYSISSDEILPGNRADGSQVAVVDEVVDDDDVVLVLLGRDVLLRWEEDSLEPLDQEQDQGMSTTFSNWVQGLSLNNLGTQARGSILIF